MQPPRLGCLKSLYGRPSVSLVCLYVGVLCYTCRSSGFCTRVSRYHRLAGPNVPTYLGIDDSNLDPSAGDISGLKRIDLCHDMVIQLLLWRGRPSSYASSGFAKSGMAFLSGRRSRGGLLRYRRIVNPDRIYTQDSTKTGNSGDGIA